MIDFDEFKGMCIDKKVLKNEDDLKNAFQILDFNGDGKVTKDEIEGRAKKRFALMDRNDDGFVEKSEMRSGRKAHRGHRKGKRRFNRNDDTLEEL